MYQITDDVWLALYEVSDRFKNLNYPKDYQPGELFIIESPLNQEMGYCTLNQNVNGNTVNIYIGQLGLMSYLNLAEVNIDDIGEALYLKYLYRQQGMTLSFERTEDLLQEDIHQIERLGFKLEDKQEWPIFSRLYPGSKPQPVEDLYDVLFLTQILRRLVELLEDIEAKRLTIRADHFILSRKESGVWENYFIDVDLVLEDEDPSPYYFEYGNELKAYRVKKLPKLNHALEGIQFLMPTEIWSNLKERGIYPLFTAFIERDSGMVVLGEITDYDPEGLEQISDQLADVFLEELRYRPRRVIVEDQYLFDMIRDFCEKIDIECECGSVTQAELFMESMIKEREEFSNPEKEQLLKMMMVCEETIETAMATPLLQELSEAEQDHFRTVLTVAIIYMIRYHRLYPLNWTTEAFRDMLDSEILNQNLIVDDTKQVYQSLLKYLRAAKEVNLLKNTDELIMILNEYY